MNNGNSYWFLLILTKKLCRVGLIVSIFQMTITEVQKLSYFFSKALRETFQKLKLKQELFDFKVQFYQHLTCLTKEWFWGFLGCLQDLELKGGNLSHSTFCFNSIKPMIQIFFSFLVWRDITSNVGYLWRTCLASASEIYFPWQQSE